MKIKNFGIVMSDTSRSRAYIQMLISNNLIPSNIIILKPIESEKAVLGKYSSSLNKEEEKEFEGYKFNPNFSIFDSLNEKGITYKLIDARSINEQHVIYQIQKVNEKYFIYSGFGGIILKSPVLTCGKFFIHVHGGFLPFYRGSTCNYYSLIKENIIGAASIIMNKEIDKGPILISKKFSPPKNKLDIDHYYDPLVRSLVLIQTIKSLLKGQVKIKNNEESMGDMFYVIHPVLKHISILK